MRSNRNRESRRVHPGKVRTRKKTTIKKKIRTRFRGRGKYKDIPATTKPRPYRGWAWRYDSLFSRYWSQ